MGTSINTQQSSSSSEGKEMVIRIVSMLSKLVERFESNEFRDETIEYRISRPKKIEDEDEEEDESKRA